jgi:hypothetical protein
MPSWGALPDDLRTAGHGLLYQFGVGLAFLGTVRKDGGPRLHPMCPIVHGDDLYAFIEEGPKQRDLLRDPRFAMHGFPPAENEDAIYLTGTARLADDPAVLTAVDAAFWAERDVAGPPDDVERRPLLFAFDVETVLLTRTTGHGDWHPQHTVWHAPD